MIDPLRILFLNNFYPPHERGGYEQLCRDVVERMLRRGHTVAVLTSDVGAGKGSSSEPSGIHRELRLQPRPGTRLGPAAHFFVTRRRDEAYNRLVLRRLLAEFHPDVVFIWNLQLLPRSLAVDVESVPGVGVAYWLAGYSPAEPDEYWLLWDIPVDGRIKTNIKKYLGWPARRVMQAEGKPSSPEMKHVGVVSEYMFEKGVCEKTLPPHARVIYNGVEVEEYLRAVAPRNNGPARLLQAGRVSRDKGVHTAVEAVGHLVSDHGIRDICLTIAGDGPPSYRDELEQIADHFRIADYVNFTGWIARTEMPALMQQSHLLLLPTIHQEPFARVILEGMAAGLAVVATLTGGTGELVRDGETGLTFPVEDSRTLAQRILNLLEDEALRCQLARAGQQVVQEHYSLDGMVDNLEGLLLEANDDARRMRNQAEASRQQ